MKPADSYENFTDIKERLDEIVQAVSDDTMPLDEALTLYEEAVKLGMRVSTMLEQEDSPKSSLESMVAEGVEQ